jgi:hypothetical protein
MEVTNNSSPKDAGSDKEEEEESDKFFAEAVEKFFPGLLGQHVSEEDIIECHGKERVIKLLHKTQSLSLVESSKVCQTVDS